MSNPTRTVVAVSAITVSWFFACMPALTDAAITDFAGTWSLQRDRSLFDATSAPDAMSLSIELQQRGLHYRSETRRPNGRNTSAEFTAALDGTPAVVSGSTGLLAPVSLQPVDDLDIEATYRLGSKRIAWSRWSLNATKSDLRVATTYAANDGSDVSNLAVYTRAGVASTINSADNDPFIASAIAASDTEVAAILAGDTQAFGDSVAADAVLNSPQNTINRRADTLAVFRKGLIRYSSFDRHIEYAGRLGEFVLIMGEETIAPKDGAPNAGKIVHRRFSDIWRSENGSMRLAARQATVFKIE